MPKLAVFPKYCIDDLVLTGAMSLRQWIELAATLGVDGLEFYSGFIDLKDERQWAEHRRIASDLGLPIPMLCCSPDFTHSDPILRQTGIDKEKHWIDLAAALGCGFCRVLKRATQAGRIARRRPSLRGGGD